MPLSRVSAAAVLLLLAVPAASGQATHLTGDLKPTATLGALPSDFNGDGVEDRVIGVPGDTTDHWWYSGGVHVVYGRGPDGTKPANQYFTTQSAFMKRLLKMYPTGLGQQIASGDFDHDGYADLAMSVPGYDEPDEAEQRINVGGVVVVYGTDHGLDPNAAQEAEVWSQDSPGVQGASPRTTTTSAARSPSATSTVTASGTSRSASRGSRPGRTPTTAAPSPCCTADEAG